MTASKRGIALACTTLLLSAAAADTFRVRSTTMVTLDVSSPEAKTAELGYNDALGIVFPRDPLFLKGLEIEVKVPQELLEYRNSIAYGLYSMAEPAPQADRSDYKATQITLQPVPSRLSFVLQIPLIRDHRLKTGPYATVIPYIHDTKSGALLFRLLPVMKVLPDKVETLAFQVKVKPLLTDEGGFRLALTYPSPPAEAQDPVSVRIDEMPVENFRDLQILKPGTHHLSVVSDDYRNEVRVFAVDQAKITELTVAMQDTAPRLFIVAPENAGILLDGQSVQADRDGRVVEPGNHTIRFTIGDYEITRQVEVQKAHDYTVSLTVDVSVTESP